MPEELGVAFPCGGESESLLVGASGCVTSCMNAGARKGWRALQLVTMQCERKPRLVGHRLRGGEGSR